MEDGTMKTNQNGVLKIAENEAAESINGNKVKRSHKLAEEVLQYKLEQLKTKREKINAKVLRKSGMGNYMLYSFTNASAVAEEMEQFNDMLKLLTAGNDEYRYLLTEDGRLADSQWFEEQDGRIFSLKHKIIKKLKEVELNKEEVGSRKSVGPRSSRYRSCNQSRTSNASSRSSIKDKAIEEKINVAELIAESNFTEQKLKMEYEANRLVIEEKVAKVQARAKVLDFLDMPPFEGEEDPKGRNITINNQMTHPNIALDKQYEAGRNLNRVTNTITVIPYLKMEGQIKLLLIIIASMRKSEADINVFSWDPLEYHYFVEIFKENIH